MPWIDAAYPKLYAACASVLGLAPGTQPPTHWNEPLAAALAFSKGLIRRALVARGFTIAQVEAWDDLESFHRRIALCNAFREGGIGQGYDVIHLGEYCKAAGELATVSVTVNGILIDPSGEAGGCSSGDFDFTTEVRVPGGFASDRPRLGGRFRS